MPKLGDTLNNLNTSDFTIDEFGRLVIHNPEVIEAVVTQNPGIQKGRLGASNNCSCDGAFQSPEMTRTLPAVNREK